MIEVASAPSNTESVCYKKDALREAMVDAEAVAEAAHRVNPFKLYNIPLVPVNCGFGIVTEDEEKKMALQPTIQKVRKTFKGKVTVLFAIRRPGCGGCREHGLQLHELHGMESDVSVVGAIKHTGVDDDALIDFYDQYFHFPIFKDSKWEIFEAMGGRKIPLWKALASIPRLEMRYKKKGIPNIPFGGDIWTQGGVLIFDKEGNLRHTYYERYGEELDLDILRKAVADARKPQRDDSSSHDFSDSSSGFTSTIFE